MHGPPPGSGVVRQHTNPYAPPAKTSHPQFAPKLTQSPSKGSIPLPGSPSRPQETSTSHVSPTARHSPVQSHLQRDRSTSSASQARVTLSPATTSAPGEGLMEFSLSSIGESTEAGRPPASAPIPIPIRTSTSRRDLASSASSRGASALFDSRRQVLIPGQSPATISTGFTDAPAEQICLPDESDPFVRLAPDDSVAAGNLAGLVDRLFVHPKGGTMSLSCKHDIYILCRRALLEDLLRHVPDFHYEQNHARSFHSKVQGRRARRLSPATAHVSCQHILHGDALTVIQNPVWLQRVVRASTARNMCASLTLVVGWPLVMSRGTSSSSYASGRSQRPSRLHPHYEPSHDKSKHWLTTGSGRSLLPRFRRPRSSNHRQLTPTSLP
jgi:hypothetical protein